MNELALFAGAGGGILGGHLLGWRTVCAVEWEPYPASVLCARQNDGFLPTFPIWDDVQTFDGRPWRGIVDVVSGGFPCQDISAAGKGAGIDGERSGMWLHMARIIHEVRPKYVFVENSPMLTSRGLGRVLGDLASMGFDARWGVLGAADVGAPHQRDRIWIAGWRHVFPHAELHRLGWGKQQSQSDQETDGKNTNTAGARLERKQWEKFEGYGIRLADSCKDVANTKNTIWWGRQFIGSAETVWSSRNNKSAGCCWWETEPDVGRVVDGVAARMDRLKAIGNGQVSEVARTAWEILSDQR